MPAAQCRCNTSALTNHYFLSAALDFRHSLAIHGKLATIWKMARWDHDYKLYNVVVARGFFLYLAKHNNMKLLLKHKVSIGKFLTIILNFGLELSRVSQPHNNIG